MELGATAVRLKSCTIHVDLPINGPRCTKLTLGSLLIGVHQSKNYDRPASPQMVPLGSPDAQASGLRRGTAGAHSYEVYQYY